MVPIMGGPDAYLAVELLKREFTEGTRVKIDYRDEDFTFEREE